ncbi:DUF3613 domain-containing protein [Corticibacter populi]|uniref:DUF3613 domain-containing protein n=1 Tax=Corticibacter populi TaxID=1550736 RepID=A0A3M6QTH8_9BURK|nr:DUF3613 domain-containing protein [Corticibacter populi]RMX06317.1 DUF3613 domain-containing protein [Corticibacter populi]RZS32145.1 uncharacterized protein DUF3613 [Corticibacter populi]
MTHATCRPLPHALSRPQGFAPSLVLGLALLLAGTGAQAQPADPAEPSTTAAEAALTHWPAAGDSDATAAATPITQRAPSERTQVGRATDHLLAMQRASQGSQPRPIDGEQASRSYQRYLQSFETRIPEHYETGVDTGVGD